MKKIIYLTGLPRAMTTLMANVLCNNPRVGGGETSPLLEYVYAARGNFSNTPEVQSALTKDVVDSAFLEFCRQGFNGYAEKITDKEIYLDKSRGWIYYSEFLREFYPDAKIIVMVRDIRSVLASMEKKWRANPSVLDKNDNPALLQFITVDQRVNTWLSQPPLGLALKRLYNAIQTKTINNMLVVRAEDFTENPEKTMRKVYEFIEEPYCELDYHNIQQMTVENDRISDFGIYGDHKIKPDIKPDKPNFKEIITPELSSSVKNNYQWFYEQFKYF